MAETTQEERDEIEDRLLGYPADTLVTENHDIRVDQAYRLLSDADRLARAEELVQSMRQFVQEDHHETGQWGSFLDEIDAFLSGASDD